MNEQKSEKLYKTLGRVDPMLLSEAENTLPHRGKVIWLRWAAAAACFALVLSMFVLPGRGNAFSVTAYAMETDENGTVSFQASDAADSDLAWGGTFALDGMFYATLSLGYEGKNIEHVTFSAEKGFFAAQSRKEVEAAPFSAIEVSMTDGHAKASRAPVPYQNLGSTVILDDSFDDLLFWGIDSQSLWTEDAEAENGGYYTVPDEIVLTAKAVFKDGTTQEIPVTIHFDDATGSWQPDGK